MKSAKTSDRHLAATASDVRALLLERLHSARRLNPRFSLRSFARQLRVDNSTLSQILRGKRRLSPRHVESVCRLLGLSEDLIRRCLMNKTGASAARLDEVDIRNIHFDLDTFLLLSAWHHFAILELTRLRGFRADSRWVAATLGISVEDANIALQRLLRLGLLEMASRDRWVDKSGDAEFRTQALTETAADRIDQDRHELALGAIARIPAKYRIHRHLITALDSAKIPELAALAEEFLARLRSLAGDGLAKNLDDVFEAEISIFPLTTLKERGKNDG